jgi:hypothetical protein
MVRPEPDDGSEELARRGRRRWALLLRGGVMTMLRAREAGAILNYATDGLASQVRYGIICHARAWPNVLKAP